MRKRLLKKQEKQIHGASQQGPEGFNGLIEEIAGHLIINIHDLADLFVAKVLVIL